MTGNRSEALARLDVFVGEWAMEARFPGDTIPGGTIVGDKSTPSDAAEAGPTVRSRFEWTLDRQFLLQRTEIPIPEAPDSLAIIGADLETGAYTQHYYDSRGVARLYAMSLDDRVWSLVREAPDFTPLAFRQRFTGTFSEDANTITGAWEMGSIGGEWKHDFALTYRRVG